jgi:hypothetical protein
MPLPNARHEAVARAFVAGKADREAGVAAGFRDSPYLRGNIARLRRRPDVTARIKELAGDAAGDARIELSYVVKRLASLADGTLAHFLQRRADGGLELQWGKPKLDFTTATAEQLRALKSIETTRGGGVKLTLHDPTAALAHLARVLELGAPERLEVTGANGGPIELEARANGEIDQARRAVIVLEEAMRGEFDPNPADSPAEAARKSDALQAAMSFALILADAGKVVGVGGAAAEQLAAETGEGEGT